MIINDKQIEIAKKITSIFENGTPVLQYNYAERLDDFRLRGVTFGLGFVTRIDGIDVINELSSINPEHTLVELYKVPMQKSINSSFYNCFRFPVKKFIKDWEKYGADPSLVLSQDRVYKRNSIDPAIRFCETYNFNNFWSFVSIFDSMVMSGEDGTIETINDTLHDERISELDRITHFNNSRIEYMKDQKDDEWNKAIDRPQIINKFCNDNWNNQTGPFDLDCGEYGKFTV